MPVIYSYPIVNPTLEDVLLGTDRENENQTVGFTVQDLVTLVDASTGTGTVTSVDGVGLGFIDVTGGPITTAGTLAVSLSAQGTPSSTTFLRGDNTWSSIEDVIPSGIDFYNNGSLLSENITSINVTGDGVTATNQGSDITLDITGGSSVAGITAITPGTGISAITTSGVTNISNTGVTRIIAGSNISISPTTGVGEVTINSTASGSADGDTQYAAGDGLRLTPSSATLPLPEFSVEFEGSNNFINSQRDDEDAAPADIIVYDQLSSGNVKTTAFQDITIDTLTSVKNYLTQTYITSTDSEGFIKNTTDSFDSIDKVINVVTLTDAEYTALTQKDPNTLYLTVATAPTQYTVTMTPLTNNIIDASGVGYSLTGDAQGAIRQGSEGASYAFETNAVLNAGYQFTTPFAATNPSGTIPNGGTTVPQVLTGTVEPIPNVVTATLNVDTSGLVGGVVGGSPVFQITGDDTGATSSGDAPHAYSFNTGISIIDNDYEFTSGPTITPSQPSTGTITSDTTVNTVITGTIQKKQGEATLVITNNITGGDENIAYQISTNPGNLTITGAVGDLAEWTATVTALGGYQFTSGPSFNPGNPVSTILTETPQNVPLTITGTVQPISACSDTTVIASAAAEIQVTLCDGSIVVLTEGVDDLSNLCIQTGEVVALTGTVTEVEFNGACSTPPRFQHTFYNTASATDFTACDNGTLDLSQTTTMFLNSNNYKTATEAFNTETTAGSPADGSYTDCFSDILTITNGQITHVNRTANLAQQSLGSFQATSDDACNNSNSQSTAFVSNLPAGVGVNKILYNTSSPFTGNSISTKTNPFGDNFVRFAVNSDVSYEVGTAGTSDEGRLTSESICQNPQVIYLMEACPNSGYDFPFFAVSNEELTIGGVYSITLGPPGVTSATLIQTSPGSTANGIIGDAIAGGCPPPTLAAVILTGNGSDLGCNIPDSAPTLTPCQTFSITANTEDFVIDYADCEASGSIEEVPAGTTITVCASDIPTNIGAGDGTINLVASTCPSEYGYPTRVAWVDANYINLKTDSVPPLADTIRGDGKLRIDNYNSGNFTDGLSTPFYDCNQTAISTLSVILDCNSLPQAATNSNYAVHADSLVDPTPGHTKISSNSNTTSITLNECSNIPDNNEDPYTPVDGSPRFITSITSAPYFSLVDENLNTVTPPVTFGNLPNFNYRVRAASDDLNIMIAVKLSTSTFPGEDSLISYDKGQTWVNIPGVPIKAWQYVDISSSGQVITLNKSGGTTGGDIWISTDYGLNFSLSTVNITFATNAGISVSSGGKYIYISGGTVPGAAAYNVLYRSNDYGQTFTDITNLLVDAGYPSDPAQRGFMSVSVSGNGERVFVIASGAIDFYSSDFGSTFSQRTSTEQATVIFKQNETGQYMVSGSQYIPGTDWYSKDFGVNKSLVDPSSSFNRNGISNSGKYSFWSGFGNGSNNIPIYINTDFFATAPTSVSWSSGLKGYLRS